MELSDDLKQKALDLFAKGWNLSYVHSALEGKVPYGDLWQLKREHPETGPVSGKGKGGEGGHGGGGGGGRGGGH